MKVSRNELRTAFMRAYEGAAYATGDFEDMADLATWSIMCGIDKIQLDDFPLQGPSEFKLLFENDGCAVIDAQGGSPGQFGMLAVHLAANLANRNGFATISVLQSSRPELILGAIAKLAKNDLNYSVIWRGGGKQYGASIEMGTSFPNYWCVAESGPSETNTSADMTILCSAQPGLLANMVSAAAIDPLRERVGLSQAQLESNFDRSLNDGIEIDEEVWQLLNQAAWPILVATTEQSREGAGPS